MARTGFGVQAGGSGEERTCVGAAALSSRGTDNMSGAAHGPNPFALQEPLAGLMHRKRGSPAPAPDASLIDAEVHKLDVLLGACATPQQAPRPRAASPAARAALDKALRTPVDVFAQVTLEDLTDLQSPASENGVARSRCDAQPPIFSMLEFGSPAPPFSSPLASGLLSPIIMSPGAAATAPARWMTLASPPGLSPGVATFTGLASAPSTPGQLLGTQPCRWAPSEKLDTGVGIQPEREDDSAGSIPQRNRAEPRKGGGYDMDAEIVSDCEGGDGCCMPPPAPETSVPRANSTQQRAKTGFGRRWCDDCSAVHHHKTLCGKRTREGDASLAQAKATPREGAAKAKATPSRATAAFSDLRQAICCQCCA